MAIFKDLKEGLAHMINSEPAENTNTLGEDNFVYGNKIDTGSVHRTVKVGAFSGLSPENLNKQNKLIEKLLDITDPLINNDTNMSVEFDNVFGCTKVTIEYYFNDPDYNIIAYAEDALNGE